MPGSVPIQPNTVMQGQAGPLARAPDAGGFADVFAGLLVALLRMEDNPSVQPASDAKPADASASVPNRPGDTVDNAPVEIGTDGVATLPVLSLPSPPPSPSLSPSPP